MFKQTILGAAAGAAGTSALNIATYADMVLRARPPSSVPQQTAGKLTEQVGLDLAPGSEGEAAESATQHRTTALGQLMGYATGLGVGAAYGALHEVLGPRWGRMMPLLGGVIAGLGATAAGDLPSVALGITKPTTWSPAEWLSDVIPHLLYGLATAATYEAFGDR